MNGKECAKVGKAGRVIAELSCGAGHMKDPCDPVTPPVVGAMCVVLTEDTEVPLRTAYWCNRVWRDPHTARPIVPGVKRYCLMAEAVGVLCGAKRVGKAGRVIAELSCGAVLREMAADLAAGAAEQESGGGAGEGAGGVGKGWVLVCAGRCVDRHGLACAERVREALDADAVRREQEHLPARAAEQDADLGNGHGNEAGVGDLDAEAGIPVAVEPRLDVDAQAGAVLGEGAPRVQEPQASPKQGYRERDVFAGDPHGNRECAHGDNRSTGAGFGEGVRGTERRYVVRSVRTGRWLNCEMYVGKMIVGWSLYGRPQSWTRAQAQALSCTWIAVSGDADLELEEVEP